MNKAKLLQLAKLVMKFAEINTDKAVLTIDGDLVVDAEVYVEKEGELVAAEDGDYTTEDGKTITIAEGKVAEIKEAELEEAPAEEETAEEALEEEIKEEAPIEDEPAVEEADPKDEKIAELEAALDEKDAVIAELNTKLAELEDKINKPVEEPVGLSKQLKTKMNIEDNPALKYFS